MDNFKIEQVRIGDKIIDRIIDEEGIEWYPFKKFLESILCKYDKVATFRDSNLNKFLRVIKYSSSKQKINEGNRTWCINKDGIVFLLKHMSVNLKGNKKLFESRKKGFYEACRFFDVKISKIESLPNFMNIPPILKDYDIWSLVCLENDPYIKPDSIWKVCPECGFYYPYKERYFGAKKKDSKCLECQGKNFKCYNKIVQFIYDNDGIDLLYAINELNDETIVKELLNFINKGRKKSQD